MYNIENITTGTMLQHYTTKTTCYV